MDLFHVSSDPLNQGTILMPYARKIHPDLFTACRWAINSNSDAIKSLFINDLWINTLYNQKSILPSVFNEVFFELTRHECFPNLHSRFESVFCTTTLDYARLFMSNYRRGHGYIYSCDLNEGECFIADMSLINTGININNPTLDEELRLMRERATAYWTASGPMRMPEILVKGTIKISELVESIGV